MKKHELHWLAGILEGEGAFCLAKNTPRIMLSMCDKDVVIRAAMLMGCATVRYFDPPQETWKRKYQAYVYGDKAVAICNRILPLMGERRQLQIRKMIAHSATYVRKFKLKAPRKSWSKQIVWHNQALQ